MKISTLLIMLVLTLSQAHASEDYPEFAGGRYPAEYWLLTMVSRGMSSIVTFEQYSRTGCITEGVKRMLEDMEAAPVEEWGVEPTLGFTCEYVRDTLHEIMKGRK